MPRAASGAATSANPACARATQVPGRPARQETLAGAERGTGNLRGTGADHDFWSFDNVKTLVLFCNGRWCGQSSTTIKDLLKIGYPAHKILRYRGGMLALRRALGHGVRIIVAHCASTGVSIDTDRGVHGPEVENVALFTRLMDDPRYRGTLHADISGLTESSRVGPLLRYVIRRIDWHDRLLNGSDYPGPGYMPGVSVKRLIDESFITAAQGQVLREIRRYNPLLFDFVLKRHITAEGTRFASSVFETEAFFRA